MNLSLAQGSSRRAILANKETQRLANENTSIKKETKWLWGFLEKVGLSATASKFTGIQASTRIPERHQSIREASVSTPTTTTSEEPASPPQTQRSVYAGAPSAASSPGTDVTDVNPSATLTAETSLPSLPSSQPSPPPKPPPPPPKPPPPPPTRNDTQRDPQSASVSPRDVTPESPLPSGTSPPTSLPSKMPPPPAPKPPPRLAHIQRPPANPPAFLDSIKNGRGGLALRPNDERVQKPRPETVEVAQEQTDEKAVKLAAAIAARRRAIGDGKDDEDAEWDFGRTRARKRPKAGKTRPYL